MRHSKAADGEVVGNIKGSAGRVYTTQLFFEDDCFDIVGTRCTCPLEEDCKHTAALYLAYLNDVPEADIEDAEDRSLKFLSLLEDKLSDCKDPLSLVMNICSPPEAKGPPNPSSVVALPDRNIAGELQDQPKDSRDIKQFKLLPLPKDVKRSFESLAASLPGGTLSENTTYSGAVSKSQKAVVYLISREHYRDEPNIKIMSVAVLKSGGFGKPSGIPVDKLLERPPQYALPEDKKIARLWNAISRENASYWYYNQSLAEADPELISLLIKRIVNTGRCYFEGLMSQPLKLGPELPGELAWGKTLGDSYRLEVIARSEDKTFSCLRSSKAHWYVDAGSSTIGPVKTNLSTKFISSILAMRSLTVEEARSLPVLLCDLGIHDVVPPPPVAHPVEVKLIKPVLRLEVKSVELAAGEGTENAQSRRNGNKTRIAVVSARAPETAKKPYLNDDGILVVEKEDVSAIQKMGEPLSLLGFSEICRSGFSTGDQRTRHFLPADPLSWTNLNPETLSQLRDEGWNISEETESALAPIDLSDHELNLEFEAEDSWWFSLALNIDLNGKQVPLLPILVSAIRSLKRGESLTDSIDALNKDGRFYAALQDGTVISIPFERIRSILMSIREFIEKGLNPEEKVATVDAADLFDDTLSAKRFVGFEKIKRLVDGLKALREIKPVAEPKNFGTELRPYQKDGLSWLHFMAHHEFGGILADDMGLGKTVQLLAHICLEKENKRLDAPYLVICPTSVLPNWVSEAAKFAPQLEVVSFHGLERHGSAKKMQKADLVVSTYPLLARDIDIFKKIKWHGVALDEAQTIKNHATKMAQAARNLKAKHKFCLTGTPVENHLGELWSQFQFLLPGLLGEAGTFKNVFRDPIEKQGDSARKNLLARRIKPFIVRRTKGEVATELPDKTIVLRKIELQGRQRDLYETVRLASSKQVRDEIAKRGFKQSQIMILDALLKLRQACCDPRLVKLTAASKITETAKLDALEEMLEQLISEGRKILVFSQFTSMIELIELRLDAAKIPYVKLTGDTKDRTTPVKQFQDGAAPVFLISLKAGGTGLNLTAADVVIHYDPWWNPAVEEQATDRAHRIGQTKKIFVYKLIAQGTIEERILEFQEKKRALAGCIYDEHGNTNLKFSESDLELLLRPIDEVGND